MTDKEVDWHGLHDAIRDAYPDDPGMADKVCSGEPDGVYRYVSQILRANQNRARKIVYLEGLAWELQDALRRISAKVEEQADYAEKELNKADSRIFSCGEE